MRTRFFSALTMLVSFLFIFTSCEKDDSSDSSSFTVVSISPKNNEAKVEDNRNILITFSEDVDLDKCTKAYVFGSEMVLYDQYGESYRLVNIDRSDCLKYGSKKFTLIALDDYGDRHYLLSNTRYTLKIKNLPSLEGNILKDFQIIFKTDNY